jgi:RNA polymerase sigma-70 factor, ECF subfamily
MVADRFQECRVDNGPGAQPTTEIEIAQAFRVAYEANVGTIYRYIYLRVGNREEAEDLTAQVFTKSLQGTDWGRDAATIRRWLLQVARTTVADHWRSFYRLRTTSLDGLLEDGWEGPTDVDNALDDLVQTQDEVADLLAQLPARYREVLQYRFLQNYSIRETAQQLGMTEANVKIVQLRALKRAAELRHRRDERGRAHTHG